MNRKRVFRIQYLFALLAAMLVVPFSASAESSLADDAVVAMLRISYPKLVKDSGAPIESGSPEWDAYFEKSKDAVLQELHTNGSRVSPYNQPSGSMLPTIAVGDTYYALPGYYRDHDPERGEVAIFQRAGSDTAWIKRVIGLPGDRIQMKAGRLWINGAIVERRPTEISQQVPKREATPEEYIEILPGGVAHRIWEFGDANAFDNTEVIEVPAGRYFVMGDNRDRSNDSRVPDFGYVPRAAFSDRPDLIFMSPELSQIGKSVQPF